MGFYNIGESSNRPKYIKECVGFDKDYIKMIAECSYNEAILETYLEYNVYTEGAIGDIFDKIKDFFSGIFDKISDFFNKAESSVKDKADKVKAKANGKNDDSSNKPEDVKGKEREVHLLNLDTMRTNLNKVAHKLDIEFKLRDYLEDKLNDTKYDKVIMWVNVSGRDGEIRQILDDIQQASTKTDRRVEDEDKDKVFLADYKKHTISNADEAKELLSKYKNEADSTYGFIKKIEKVRVSVKVDKDKSLKYLDSLKNKFDDAKKKIDGTNYGTSAGYKRLASVSNALGKLITKVGTEYLKNRQADCAVAISSYHKYVVYLNKDLDRLRYLNKLF